MLQDLDGVVFDEPQVPDACAVSFQQAMPDARLVHLDAEEIPRGVLECLLHQRVAVAESDFENDGCMPAEQPVEIHGFGTELDAVRWPQNLERPRL